jgi:hypothetical protein
VPSTQWAVAGNINLSALPLLFNSHPHTLGQLLAKALSVSQRLLRETQRPLKKLIWIGNPGLINGNCVHCANVKALFPESCPHSRSTPSQGFWAHM